MLSAYGLAVGDAFQMRDDILGAFGDSEITGKPVGGDFHEGKPTPLLAHACAMATSSDLAVLEKVGQPGLTNEDISQIQQAVINTGALAVIEQRIASLHDDAVQSLDRSQLQGDAYDALVHLADVVTQRNL
jgi:geranylgeranyl diphosphate synthase type I